jgi:hypothetical protein
MLLLPILVNLNTPLKETSKVSRDLVVRKEPMSTDPFTLGARGDILTQYIASTLLVLGQ